MGVVPFVGFYGDDRRILSSYARNHARLLRIGRARQHDGGSAYETVNDSFVHTSRTRVHLFQISARLH